MIMPSMQNKISKLQLTSRVAMLSLLLIMELVSIRVQAQPAPEVSLDRVFRYESTLPGTAMGRELLPGLKKWMGAYQRIRKDGDSYLAVFDGGSIPISAKFKTNGAVESLVFGCPITRSLSINDAPLEVRTGLSKCAGFKS
jgi:hypothetical protein